MSEITAASQVFHYSYEKAGLIVVNQPIPWNADSVLIEVQVRLAQFQARSRDEFQLRLANQTPAALEDIRSTQEPGVARLIFRFPVPTQTTQAELFWRQRSLGSVTLPIVSAEEFLAKLRFDQAAVFVQLADGAQACQAFLKPQCRGLYASAQISSPVALAPLADFQISAVVTAPDEEPRPQTIRLSSSQLRARQAIVALELPRPRKTGHYRVRWLIDEREQARVLVRVATAGQLSKALHLSAVRFLTVSTSGEQKLWHFPPALGEDVARVGPVFLVKCLIPGIAADCTFEVRASGRQLKPIALARPEARLSDGLTPIAPGTFARADLGKVELFHLYFGARHLGQASILPAPTAEFTGEGGFRSAGDDFLWSPVAEQELMDRLGKLLG